MTDGFFVECAEEAIFELKPKVHIVKTKKAIIADGLSRKIWRRSRDLNPRWAINPRRFSRPVH